MSGLFHLASFVCELMLSSSSDAGTELGSVLRGRAKEVAGMWRSANRIRLVYKDRTEIYYSVILG